LNITKQSMQLFGKQFITFFEDFDYFVVGSACVAGEGASCFDISATHPGVNVEFDIALLWPQSYMRHSEPKTICRFISSLVQSAASATTRGDLYFTLDTIKLSEQAYWLNFCGHLEDFLIIQQFPTDISSFSSQHSICDVSKISNHNNFLDASCETALSWSQINCLEDVFTLALRASQMKPRHSFVYLGAWGMAFQQKNFSGRRRQNVEAAVQLLSAVRSLYSRLEFNVFALDEAGSSKLFSPLQLDLRIATLHHFSELAPVSHVDTAIKAVQPLNEIAAEIMLPLKSEVLFAAVKLLPFPANISQAHILVCVTQPEMPAARAVAYSWQRLHKRGFIHVVYRISLFEGANAPGDNKSTESGFSIPPFRSCMLQFEEYISRLVFLRSQQVVVGLIGLTAVNNFIMSSCTVGSRGHGLILGIDCEVLSSTKLVEYPSFYLPHMLTFGTCAAGIGRHLSGGDVLSFAGVACSVHKYVQTLVHSGNNAEMDDSAMFTWATALIVAVLHDRFASTRRFCISLELCVEQIGIDTSRHIFSADGSHTSNLTLPAHHFTMLEAEMEEEFDVLELELAILAESNGDLGYQASKVDVHVSRNRS
jgi:hypothetical protein